MSGCLGELETFDRNIFESMVEKVIVGGEDQQGKIDPYKIVFVYRTGFKDAIDDSKEKYSIDKRRGKKSATGSNTENDMSSYDGDISYQDYGGDTKYKVQVLHSNDIVDERRDLLFD